MNKNVTGIILIVLAIVIFFFYGWPKLQPYFGGAPEGGSPGPGQMTTGMPLI